jgi:hypothetical protein
MNTLRRAIVLAATCLQVGCDSNSGHDLALEESLEKYYFANTSGIEKVRIAELCVDGDAAKALMTPVDVDFDSATAFMKKKNGVWVGVDFGTGFEEETLTKLGIPKFVQYGCHSPK